MTAAADPIAVEYAALTGASAFVVRQRPGALEFAGADAAEFLHGQVTNDIEGIAIGEGRYAALLTPKGKIRTDMRILRPGGDGLLLLVEATYLPVVRRTVDTFRIGFHFTYSDRSDELALVSLIGPTAHDELSRLASGEPPSKIENSTTAVSIAGHRVFAVTTLFGVDLIVDASALDVIVNALRELGVQEASEEAAEIVRVELGIPRIGRELDENTIPEEAGLNQRAVDFEKGCYVGQETVARLHYKGKPNRRLRGLRAAASLTAGAPVAAADGRDLGRIGSAAISPANGPIALAILRREAVPGDIVTANGVSATVVHVDV